MKILFLNPPMHGEKWYGIRSGCRWSFISQGTIQEKRERLKQGKDFNYATYPFFLSFACAILNKQGLDAKVYDALALCHTYVEFYARVKAEAPDKVVVEPCIPSFEQDIIILQNLKEMGYQTVICGPTVKHKLAELKQYKFIDEIWEGNYVQTLAGADYPNNLPMPYRDDETIYCYNDYTQVPQLIKKPQLSVWSSFGCPYNCNFCLWRHTMTFGKYKPRPVSAVRDEIKYCVDRWKFQSVLFDDDTFNVGDKRTKEVARMMKSDIKLPWMAMVRADTCSIDTFKVMKDCGCTTLKVGVETFSPELLKKINKGLEARELQERILQLVDLGYNVYLSAMCYIPGETPEDRELTKQILRELYSCGCRWQYPHCLPLAGTPSYDDFVTFQKKQYGDLIEDFEYGKYYDNPELQKRIEEFSKNVQ